MKGLLLSFALFVNLTAFSQIKLPKSFKHINQDFHVGSAYTDGTYRISIYPFGHDGFELDDIIESVDKLSTQTYIHTKDNLYIFSGKEDDMYYYKILLPESLFQLQVRSKVNDKNFSYYSEWLLKEVRDKRNKPCKYPDGYIYLVDWTGKEEL